MNENNPDTNLLGVRELTAEELMDIQGGSFINWSPRLVPGWTTAPVREPSKILHEGLARVFKAIDAIA